MLTSLIHIGDFHAAPGLRNGDRYRALEQIQAYGEACQTLGAYLWPGDLNDARMTIEDRNRLAEALLDMARMAPVVICYGNHDLPGDLDVFGHLRGAHPIYVVDLPQCLRLKLATGQFATIFVLPYPQRAGLVAAGVAKSDVVDAAADLLEPIFTQASAELEAAAAAGDVTLMIGHVNVAGAIASTGQPNIGREIELRTANLDRLGAIPKLLNHIHKPQQIADAHYAGSVCRMDYGETEEKRFLVVNFFDESTEIESRPIEIAPMFHVEGTLDRNGFRLTEACACAATDVERRWHAGDWTGCDVRVRYHYKASERSLLDESKVREPFASALRLKVESIAEPDRELRSPDVAAAKTLPAKLAAYRKEPTLAPAVATKVDMLEQLAPEQLLSRVSTMLAEIEALENAMVAA